ncbi:diaminobutyrate--2-oxoglutarate transaminase [Alkalicoccus halolimnae]|uniref:Diaminobutyrate--2-oxoglutarate transaminase n=1 Tax=Alkalicoccus halolimnae TaxID=1667239 RepID=A0A5C7F7Z4_9BACI|nr:diaminobutyrate--2-oxoglutarate transaminase [Alkalicoccus halolimnae]TXF86802.1 diaminobutyrate--2-oxoglutarate transaminase [Alkalicoccus halolimnae]
MNKKLQIIEDHESSVRSYVRSFPAVFTKARGYRIWDEDGNEYIDFFAGAGALNYGHNEPAMKKKLVDYILDDGITHSLDKATDAKVEFIDKFNEVIMKPRNMDYKIMFPGPTGTNTVESALKIARKMTGRTDIVSFTNGFHGMTIGSLAVTGNSMKRKGAGIPLSHTVTMPYDNFVNDEKDTLDYFERFLEDNGSGVAIPAAVIFETVQGEGGINAASIEWMQRLERICREWGIMLIVDDVQAGVGRTGTFFSFEPAGIKPDVVCLSKSIGGYGLPLAITLIKPEFDKWKPGEHNGTFRGNNMAFVTATESLTYWEDPEFEKSVQAKAATVTDFLTNMIEKYPEMQGRLKGRGLMQGIASDVEGFSEKVAEHAFERYMIMETAGGHDEVFKLFPPINIDEEGLQAGLEIIELSIQDALKSMNLKKEAVTN